MCKNFEYSFYINVLPNSGCTILVVLHVYASPVSPLADSIIPLLLATKAITSFIHLWKGNTSCRSSVGFLAVLTWTWALLSEKVLLLRFWGKHTRLAFDLGKLGNRGMHFICTKNHLAVLKALQNKGYGLLPFPGGRGQRRSMVVYL